MSDPSSLSDGKKKRKSGDHFEFGICLIFIGAFFLFSKMNLIDFSWWNWWQIWACVVVALGTIRLLRADDAEGRLSGFFQILFGGAIFAMFEHLWGLNIFIHWPLVLIGIGIYQLLKYAVQTSSR